MSGCFYDLFTLLAFGDEGTKISDASGRMAKHG